MIKRLITLLFFLPNMAFAVAPNAPTSVAVDMTPNWIFDETFPFRVYTRNAGDWITEVVFGNGITGVAPWYDAPSGEINWGRGRICADGPVNSGKIYCSFTAGENWPILVERDYATGTARLVLAQYGKDEGDSHEAAGGHPFYNSYDDTVYLMGNGPCIRKLVDDGDGTYSVSLVAGSCSTVGNTNGNGASARFGAITGAAADGIGNIWVQQNVSGSYIRKIDVNGNVTTVDGSVVRDDGETTLFKLLSSYVSRNVSPGRNSNQMHFADTYNSSVGWSAQRLNTTTYAMTRVQGIDFSNDTNKRKGIGLEKDGPALTHSYLLASGACVFYAPFYDAIILSGQDSATMQILYYDTEWVTALAHYQRPWISNLDITDEELQAGSYGTQYNPLNYANTRITTPIGTDRFGGIYYYMVGYIPYVFRTHNPTLGGLALGDIP